MPCLCVKSGLSHHGALSVSERVSSLKTMNKLDWSDNTEALYHKGQSGLFFLRRLRSFNVCTRLLRLFYQTVVASAIFFATVCWEGGIGSGSAIKLNKLVRKASSVVGMKLDREEDERKAASYNGRSLSPSPNRAEATQEHVQPQTHPTTCLKALWALFQRSDYTTPPSQLPTALFSAD